MARITADQKLSTSPALLWANDCSDLGKQKGKLRFSSRHEANSEEGLQDEVIARGAQGPSPLSIFLCFTPHPIHLSLQNPLSVSQAPQPWPQRKLCSRGQLPHQLDLIGRMNNKPSANQYKLLSSHRDMGSVCLPIWMAVIEKIYKQQMLKRMWRKGTPPLGL